MREKLKREEGLTLVEMLAAVVILILLGLMLNTGLQMAVRSYHSLTAEAETQLLASTLADALADDLRYARDVVTGNAETVTNEDGTTTEVYPLDTYTSDSYGTNTAIEAQSGDGQVYANGKRVLPPGAYGPGATEGEGAYRVEELAITCGANSCITIHIKVKEAKGDISAEAELTVRCLNGFEDPGGVVTP